MPSINISECAQIPAYPTTAQEQLDHIVNLHNAMVYQPDTCQTWTVIMHYRKTALELMQQNPEINPTESMLLFGDNDPDVITIKEAIRQCQVKQE